MLLLLLLLCFNELIILSAVLDKKLAEYAAENSLSGFEFLTCIPGTIGGGLKMNAGCFGSEIKDILVSIQAMDKKGNILTIPAKKINFDYRNNNLSDTNRRVENNSPLRRTPAFVSTLLLSFSKSHRTSRTRALRLVRSNYTPSSGSPYKSKPPPKSTPRPRAARKIYP